jgi:hypothetical protein
MSESIKEDEQLLQDASTLLMFANVAAKQQQMIHPLPPPPVQLPAQIPSQSQPHQSKLPPGDERQLQQQFPYLTTQLLRTQPNSNSPTLQQRSLLEAVGVQPPDSRHNVQPPPAGGDARTISHGMPQLHSFSPHMSQNSPPSLGQEPKPQQLPQNLNSVPSYPNPNNYPVYNQVNHQVNHFPNYNQPNTLQSPPINHAKEPLPISGPITTSETKFLNEAVHVRAASNPTVSSKPVQATASVLSAIANSPVQPPAKRGSISLLMNNESSSGDPSTYQFPKKKQKSVSPKSTSVSSEQTHRRSLSHPENKSNSAKILHISPGPANVALERGINLVTGERNTSNAVIAAAALAAAAEVPLPLKSTYKVTENEDIAPISIGLKTSLKPSVEEKPTRKASPTPKKASPTPKKSSSQAKKQSTSRKQSSSSKKQSEIQNEPVKSEFGPSISSEIPPTSPQLKQEPVSRKDDETELEDNEKTDDEKEELRRENFDIPPLESYKVDPDSGLIGCICSIEDDDGFTVQCDECFRWQHCHCMGFKSPEEVPEDEYKCYLCDMLKWGKLNPEACEQETLKRLNLEKQEKQLPNPKRKHLSTEKSEAVNGGYSSDASTNSKKRKVSESSEKKELNETKDLQKLELPIKDNELLKDGVTAESYQSVYYNLKENDYKRADIRRLLADKGAALYNEFISSKKLGSSRQLFNDVEIMSLQQFKGIKFSKIILPNHQKYMSENNKNITNRNKKHNKTSIKVKAYTDNQKQKFNGISKLALYIDSNDELTIPENTPIIEYLGEIDLFDNYVKDLVNQYSTWGTTKPKVLKSTLFLPEKLDIVLDSRFVGNEARFIRKSCPATANCRIKQIYIPETNSFKFIIVTSKDIVLKSNDADEELRLSWEWDPRHPILLLYENNEKFELLPEASRSAVISYVDNILHFVECGCCTTNLSSSCILFKVKKATAYLLRSTRKASSISNVNLTKSKEELIFSKKSKKYIPWDDRLLERENIIELNFLVTTNDLEKQEQVESNKKLNELENIKTDDTKPPSLFKIPFKQQILTKYKQMSKIDSEDTIENEDANISEEEIELPFPIVSELASKIEHSIDETLKPIENEIEAKLVEKKRVSEKLLDDKPTTTIPENKSMTIDSNSTTEEIKKAENILASVEDTHEVKDEPELPPVAPKVVKKLSFADYKKKMK